MIAPTNCNPDCDCAQRGVRCQRVRQIDEIARESLVRGNVFLDQPPPYVIPASLAKQCSITPSDLLSLFEKLEKEFPADMGIAPLPEDSLVQQREFTPEENAAFDAADAKMRHHEELQRMEIVPFVTSDSNTGPSEIKDENGNTIVTLTSSYLGAFGPFMLVTYDRTDLRLRLIKAFRECELDCGCWSDNALNELADLAIATLEKVA